MGDGTTQAIERYLRAGGYDHDHPAWPGQNLSEQAAKGHDDLLDALATEVQRRATGKRQVFLTRQVDVPDQAGRCS
jgi:hypothetical protein